MSESPGNDPDLVFIKRFSKSHFITVSSSMVEWDFFIQITNDSHLTFITVNISEIKGEETIL